MSVVLFEWIDIKGFKRKIEKIGSGANGNVFIAKSTRDKKLYALKRINADLGNRNEKSQFDILKPLDHPNITKFYDVHIDKRKDLYIQMELCKDNLDSILRLSHKVFGRKRGEKLNDVEYIVSCKIFKEILAGIKYLHNGPPRIIHRDLKPANILVNYQADKSGNFIKISDFGNSILHSTSKSHTANTGTEHYMATEVRYSRHYNLKADIYSLGVIGAELFSCDTSAEPEIDPEESYKINLIDLLVSMVDGKPSVRPDCVEIMEKFETCLINIDKSIIEKIHKRIQLLINIKCNEFFINILKVEQDNLCKSANLPNPEENIIQDTSSKRPGPKNCCSAS